MRKFLVYLAVPVLYVLHQDFWFAADHEKRLLGMPIGLSYQVLFCLAASLLMYLLIRFAWPAHLEVEAKEMRVTKADAWH
jgi:hypothetical protein